MRRALLIVILAGAFAASAACDLLSNLTKPSGSVTTSAQSLNGTWATTQSLPGSSGSLADS